METVKLSSKGQIVIPKEIRQAHHWSVGTEFIVSAVGDELRLTPAPLFPPTRVEDGVGLLARKGRKKLSEEETRQRIGKMLKAHDDATKTR